MISRALQRNLALLIASILAFCGTTLLMISLVWGANDQAELARVSRENCLQIESLKALQRNEARRMYRNLELNLRLLDIELTPQIRQVARENRDVRLRRFAAGEC